MSAAVSRSWRPVLGGVLLAALALAGWGVRLDGEPHPAWRGFGRVHPVVVHFPIVLLTLVPLVDLVGRRRPAWREVADVLLGLGLLGALGAVTAGLVLAYADGQSGSLLTSHLRGGVIVAGGATLAWMVRPGRWARASLPLLVATALVLGWAAHQGGSLTHGEYYLTEGLPPAWRKTFGLAEPPVPEIDPADTLFGAAIRPTLDRACVSCHGPAKQKGNYRVDAFALLVAGGASGRAAIVPGDLGHSELLRRIRLPRGARQAMPPEGQPRPSDAEVRLLEWWIAQGAKRDLTLADAVARDPGFADLWRAAQPPGAEVELPRVGDYSGEQAEIARLTRELGIVIVPVSKRPGDGLILRARGHEAAFDGAALAAVAPLAPYIVEAELAGTRLGDADLVVLRTFTALARIDLSRTAVTGATLDSLAALPRLESVNLCDSALDDRGLARLAAPTSLRRAYVAGSAVTPGGLARFRAARPECEVP